MEKRVITPVLCLAEEMFLTAVPFGIHGVI
jgi:hypothetical protein